MNKSQLEETVIPVIAKSYLVARHWSILLGMVFIDGGHSLEAAMCDYRSWAGHIIPGGILAIHDIFPDSTKGGQAPYTIWKLALASGLFEEIEITNTLGLLRRIKL